MNGALASTTWTTACSCRRARMPRRRSLRTPSGTTTCTAMRSTTCGSSAGLAPPIQACKLKDEQRCADARRHAQRRVPSESRMREMAVWEIRPGDMLDRPVLVAADKQDVRDRVFVTDGRAKDWAHRPPVELF